MKRIEIERAIDALNIADKKMYDNETVTIRVYNEISDYIDIARSVLTRALATL